jgi:hypothetical protein
MVAAVDGSDKSVLLLDNEVALMGSVRSVVC